MLGRKSRPRRLRRRPRRWLLMWWEDELLWDKSEKVGILLAIVFVIGFIAYIMLCECGTVV